MKDAVPISVKSRIFLDQGHCRTPYNFLEKHPETIHLIIIIKDWHCCLGVECQDAAIRIH